MQHTHSVSVQNPLQSSKSSRSSSIAKAFKDTFHSSGGAHGYGSIRQLILVADPGDLSADDLVKILGLLSTRLKGTHQQSVSHMHQLTLARNRAEKEEQWVMEDFEVTKNTNIFTKTRVNVIILKGHAPAIPGEAMVNVWGRLSHPSWSNCSIHPQLRNIDSISAIVTLRIATHPMYQCPLKLSW